MGSETVSRTMGSISCDNRMSEYPFAHLEPPTLETLNQLQADYRNDARDYKVDLMVGSYCSDSGQVETLESVRLAKVKIANDPTWSHGYPSSHLGEPSFRHASLRLIFGDSSPFVTSSRVASMQALGGSGACHMGAVFLKKYYLPRGSSAQVFIPKDSWANHVNVFRSAGLRTAELPYFDTGSHSLDMESLLNSTRTIPRGSIVALQVCGNNPTGCDLEESEWVEMGDIMRERNLFAFLDVAYQGFVSGSVENDSNAIRILAAKDVALLVAATYSKAFGLYGERVGHLCIPTPDATTTAIVEGHMKLLARAETGAQPQFGARIVSTVLLDDDLRNMWKQEVMQMAKSLQQRRFALLQYLEEAQPGAWAFIARQKGMFLFTGLNITQITRLREQHAIYLQETGRISVAGLTASNIVRVAHGLLSVTQMT